MKIPALILPFLMLTAIATSAGAAENRFPWQTDYEQAKATALAEGRPLLLKFTGSDWCPPCRRLNAEVFETDEMIAFAGEALVPVYVDFPRRTALAPELKAQNNQLAQEFGVRSYPTVWVVSASGEKLGKLGYQPGGPESYIRSIERILRQAAD